MVIPIFFFLLINFLFKPGLSNWFLYRFLADPFNQSFPWAFGKTERELLIIETKNNHYPKNTKISPLTENTSLRFMYKKITICWTGTNNKFLMQLVPALIFTFEFDKIVPLKFLKFQSCVSDRLPTNVGKHTTLAYLHIGWTN